HYPPSDPAAVGDATASLLVALESATHSCNLLGFDEKAVAGRCERLQPSIAEHAAVAFAGLVHPCFTRTSSRRPLQPLSWVFPSTPLQLHCRQTILLRSQARYL